MLKILDTGDSTSTTVRILSERHHGIFLESAGGTWSIETQLPNNSWVSIEGGSLAQSSTFVLEPVVGALLRITGGMTGSEAWIAASDGSVPEAVS